MRVRPVFRAFADLKQSSLMWKIWAANSLDIILDFVLTFVFVLFNATSLVRVPHSRTNPVATHERDLRQGAQAQGFPGIVNTDAKGAKIDGEEGNPIKGR
ncbi:hypothetical protein DFH11DRAFT_1608108 [Phellopilus nigrolimitatus]|nr:hypothetical protein DFH11DRAFT_1608108 [Phellopilus nigrolimitatus]